MRRFTSDTHFGHRNIINLSNRPFNDVTHMNEMLVVNWNTVVCPDETVFHLGDVALGPIRESLQYIKRLNGTKFQIVGNHDRNFYLAKRSGGLEPYEWDDEYMAAGFSDVKSNLHITLSNGMDVNLSHFPYDGDSHDGDRFTGARLPDDGRVLIHGHTHSTGNPVSRSKAGTLQIHVGVDAWGFRPVSEDEVIDLIQANL